MLVLWYSRCFQLAQGGAGDSKAKWKKKKKKEKKIKQNEPILQSSFNLDKGKYAWKHRLPGVSGSPLQLLLSPPSTEAGIVALIFRLSLWDCWWRCRMLWTVCFLRGSKKYLPVQPAVPHTDPSSLRGVPDFKVPTDRNSKSHPRHLAEQLNAVWPSLTCKMDFYIMWSTLVPGVTGFFFWNPGLHF